MPSIKFLIEKKKYYNIFIILLWQQCTRSVRIINVFLSLCSQTFLEVRVMSKLSLDGFFSYCKQIAEHIQLVRSISIFLVRHLGFWHALCSSCMISPFTRLWRRGACFNFGFIYLFKVLHGFRVVYLLCLKYWLLIFSACFSETRSFYFRWLFW